MTEKDKKLIEKAEQTNYIDWYLVSKMEEEAESEEAQQLLHSISSRLYHIEEYYAGLL